MTRRDQMFAKFSEYHKNNPEVWGLFVRFSDSIRGRRSRYSSRAIVHRIRWEKDVSTSGDEFRINDHYSVFYARMYMIFRDCEGFFEIRVQKSKNRPAYAEEQSTRATSDRLDFEPSLVEKLRELLYLTDLPD